MSLRRILYGCAGACFLTACGTDEEGGPTASSTFSFGAALADFFVADFSPYEADALALRTTNPRYTIQDFFWSIPAFPAVVYDSFSLAHSNVEYAHAVGLTGAGQIISIIDSGFLTTHDEFSGKTISTVSGLAALGVDDHGTSVASVAAGVSDNGQTIGVAPGADLQLGSFNTLETITNATTQATTLGAIVQNNSWGYGLNISRDNFDLIFDGSTGSAYLSALSDFTDSGLVVFAASNIPSDTSAEIMAALPSILPALETSWLATINAVPVFSGSDIVSVSRVSAACLEAAAWCLAADGTSYGAVASGTSDYELATGTSFAAPQVAGAVALLAEAFPTLSAQEIRARLLASANNGFYEHTGFVEFAPGIEHGFDDEFGHGFLDLRAALLPIGGAYVPTTLGNVELNQPVLVSGGMAGDSLSTRLAQYDIMVVDGLGGGFSTPADVLTGQALPTQNPAATLGELLLSDLNSDGGDPFHPSPAFSSFVTGQELNVDLDDNRFTLLLPQEGSSSPSYGVSFSRGFDLANTTLNLGLSAMHEGDGFVGMQGLSATGSLKSDHLAAIFDWAVPMSSGQEIHLSGSVGMARPNGSIPTMSMNPVQYNSLKLSYDARDVWGGGDRVSFGVGLPHAVQAGSVGVVLPVAMSASGATFETQNVSLSPDARQLDLSIGYGTPISKNSEIIMSLTHSLNDGNISGRSDTVSAIGYRFQF